MGLLLDFGNVKKRSSLNYLVFPKLYSAITNCSIFEVEVKAHSIKTRAVLGVD